MKEMRHGPVPRSMDPSGLEQELRALLALYQALGHAMTDASRTTSHLDPDRASGKFHRRDGDRLGDCDPRRGDRGPTPPGPGPGDLTAALAHLPPSPSPADLRDKSLAPRYARHPLEERPPASTRISHIDIEKPGPPPGPTPSPAARTKIINLGSRIDGVFTILHAEPDRAFTPTELAQTLEITNINSFNVQLTARARRGRVGGTGRDRYTNSNNYRENGPSTCADQP